MVPNRAAHHNYAVWLDCPISGKNREHTLIK